MSVARGLLVAAMIALAGCGAGEADDDFISDLIDSLFEPSSTPPALEISEPTKESSYATTAEALNIGGTTSDPDAAIIWTNSAGGEGDTTPDDSLCAWLFSYCTSDWAFTVPLARGYNWVTVVASGDGGETVRTIAITRY